VVIDDRRLGRKELNMMRTRIMNQLQALAMRRLLSENATSA
jgi:hypothetical protein